MRCSRSRQADVRDPKCAEHLALSENRGCNSCAQASNASAAGVPNKPSSSHVSAARIDHDVLNLYDFSRPCIIASRFVKDIVREVHQDEETVHR